MTGKKLSRRDFLLISGGAAAGTLLAACQPQVVKETMEVEVTREVEVEKEIEVTVEVPAEVELVQITQLGLHSWEELYPYFYDDNPGIEVLYEGLSWDAYFEQAQVRLASGAPDPDVIEVDVPMTTPYAYRDWLLPLDDLYTQAEKEDWLTSSYEAGQYEGRLVSAPLSTSTLLLMYNKSILDRAGIEPPGEDDRLTWEQVAELAQQLTFDDDGDGTPETWGFMWEQYQRIYQMGVMPMSLGGKLIGDDGLTVRGVLDAEPWIEAFTYYWKAFNEWKFAPTGDVGWPSDTLFRTGKLALETMGSWNIGQNADAELDFEWGVSRHPYFEDGIVVTPTGSWHCGINANSDEPEAAGRLVHWLSTTRGNELLWRYGPHDMPALKSVLTLFETSAEFDDPPKYYERVAADEAKQNPQGRARTPGFLEYEEILADAMLDMQAGADVTESLATAVDRIEAEMAKYT